MEDRQYTFVVCVSFDFVYDSFQCRMIYFYVVESVFSFIAFGLVSNLERFFPLSDYFKKSIPCFLLAFYDLITNI